ncbi:hypothetical protein PM082_023025 [Marasmius tenuissimus]|nr:hypothetical protein PM082_023025 [Marasmius tenuissimus]
MLSSKLHSSCSVIVEELPNPRKGSEIGRAQFSKTRHLTDWQPPILSEALRKYLFDAGNGGVHGFFLWGSHRCVIASRM